ncbi:MAG: hypothetical protein ACFE9C_18645 [Candidatus Hodarchaeota archaeon]
MEGSVIPINPKSKPLNAPILDAFTRIKETTPPAIFIQNKRAMIIRREGNEIFLMRL